MSSRYPAPGSVLLGKYRVDSLIGEGGMGVVLKAHHIDLDEFVAIKCLLPDHMDRPDIVQRFLREAKAAVKLKGEHVARVLDVGRLENDVPYIVMEYLEGADLNAILKHHGAQTPSIAVDLLLQACEAIAEAHSLGIIHRDIKASNFYITQQEGQAPILKVLDFGIATAPEGTSDLTSTQSVIGTPSYMAPEQMRSSRTADARSDIWSMGVVLYELLEGARPFRSEVYSDLCLKVGMDPPSPMENPDVPDGLIDVVMKCLEKPIDRRYQTVAELAYDLMRFASDPVLARATVEQCARLIGRRATKMSEGAAARAENDSTPIPKFPKPTPATGQVIVDPSSLTLGGPTPIPAPVPIGRNSSSHASLLGRPTPVPSSQPKTPTSLQGSSGQVALAPSEPRRRGLWIAMSAAAGLGIVAFLVFGLGIGRGKETANAQPAAAPAPAPIQVEPPAAPPPPPPPLPEPVAEPVPEPVKVAEPAVAPPPPRTVPKKGTPRTPAFVRKNPKKDTVKREPTPAEPGGDLYIKRQ